MRKHPPSSSSRRRPRPTTARLGHAVGLTAALACGVPLATSGLSAQTAGPESVYRVVVANESSDLVSVVRFGPDGAALERDLEVGLMPADLDGAHGVQVTPDGRLFVSLAHGTPNGKLWVLDAQSGALLDSTTVGRFPATIATTPDGSLAFVVNFNLHGDPVPSSVSAVFVPGMQELARIETCVKPHGSRVNHAGTAHYSVCAGSDQLVEISVESLAVSRRLSLVPGHEMAFTAAGGHLPDHTMEGEMEGRMRAEREGDHGAHEMEHRAEGQGAPAPADLPMIERHLMHHGAAAGGSTCGPTWVVASADDRHLYVACNKNDEVLEIAAADFTVTRRFATGKGPYNLAATGDGRLLLVTNKGGQSVSVIDLASGDEAARLPTTRSITHGIVVTPDDRFAFVTNEAVGATRGTVDVIDLATLERVASVELHHQPGGIDFWTAQPVSR